GRGRPARARVDRLLAPGDARLDAEDPDRPGAPEAARARARGRPGGAGRPGRRPGPVSAGAGEPGRQRDQVHRAWRGPRPGGAGRARGRLRRALDRRSRHRHRHPAREAAGDLRAVRPGGQLHHPPVRRDRPRPGDRAPAGGADGRADLGREHAGPGEHVPRGGAARSGRGLGPAGGAEAGAAAAGEDIVNEPEPGTLPRILIAEDDPVSRRVLESTLRRWGYEVVVTADGEEAWAALQAVDAPPLVVLDWMMPGLDGLEVCRRLRTRPAATAPYVVLLTARTRREDVVQGLEAGADDFVGKPFDREELRARLNVGVRMVALQQKLAARVRELEEAMSRVQ